MDKHRFCIVVGTRPGIIKMSPLVRQCESLGIEYYILHTGQHYSPSMDRKFFEDLGLPDAKYKVEETWKYTTHAGKTAAMLIGVERVLIDDPPSLVFVCGDANTNLAAALAARKLHLPIGHVEAGLRSFDWRMPEEHNRVMIDHISELLFAPTEQAAQHLRTEHVRGSIHVTGNTIVDAVALHASMAEQKSSILDKLKLQPKCYSIVTMHREENVDSPEVLSKLLRGIRLVAEHNSSDLIFPIHPRTRKRIIEFGLMETLVQIPRLRIVDPLGYLDMVKLLKHACVVLTDSGGLQEESCVLNVPCVTLRETTERQETVKVGANRVVGTEPDQILRGYIMSFEKNPEWENPFGDGLAAKRIISISKEFLTKTLVNSRICCKFPKG